MRRLFAVLALLFAITPPVAAQFTKPKIHYVFSFIGTSKINGFSSGYSALGIAAKNKTFVADLYPFVAQWGDTTKFSGAAAASIRTPKLPLYVGLGKMIGNGSNTYGTLSWWGSNKLPFMTRLGLGKNYFTISFAFNASK